MDFKGAFDVVERDPDYFLACSIEWDPESGVIQLDTSKYLREVIAKFDMLGVHPSPIPDPAGTKIYGNENRHDDEKFRNLYQQYCGCINYAVLIRPELSYYTSQICRVMNIPNEENLRISQNILKYAITYSDWDTSVDTRHRHG